MTLFSDPVARALDTALDGTALRQRVVSQNISNAMTPGYRAQRVAFETALAAAVRGGEPGEVRPELVHTGDAAREDGNNVRLEDESALLLRSGLQYDALVQAANYRHKIYSTALSR